MQAEHPSIQRQYVLAMTAEFAKVVFAILLLTTTASTYDANLAARNRKTADLPLMLMGRRA